MTTREQKGVDGWLPIDGAPKDRNILVVGGEWWSDDRWGNETYPLTKPKIAYWHRGQWHVGNGYAHDIEHWAKPTHWRELPAFNAGRQP